MNVSRNACFLVAVAILSYGPSARADQPASATAQPAPRKAAVTLPGDRQLPVVDFERHVMGLLGRLGCNSGSCHGSFQGQNGFRLSLFGHDPQMDYKELTDEAEGPRVYRDDPASSLALLKPTLEIEHKGGKRFDTDSWMYQVLLSWIEAGAPWQAGSGKLTHIDITPRDHQFTQPDETVQLTVLAQFADGSREDVTAFCEIRVKDDYVAEVSADGLVRALRPGDTAVVASYRGHVLSTRALVGAGVPEGFVYPEIPEANSIDREVFAKLRKLNIVPSDLSTDSEFLRRLYIDTIGCLPTPDEVRSFLADNDANKRHKKIDELLSHPLHAALWATKLSDITGNNTAALEQPAEKRSKMWYDWLRQRLEQNVPYDEIVGGILTATSRNGMPPDQWIKHATALDEAALDGFESSYADRPSLDLYWNRKGLTLEQMAEQTAAALMGVRLECAQCHKHPYDRWTQADYRAFANIFGHVKTGVSPEAKKTIDSENNRRKKIQDKKRKLPTLREVYVDQKSPRRLNDPVTNRPLPPTALGGPEFDSKQDSRAALLAWLREPENPFFARSFVNRVWGHYFGIGLVEPVDDFSIANPPSNDKLLDMLAGEFIEHRYDIRHVERMILQSRCYQSSALPNDTNIHDRNNFARSYPRQMMAEVIVYVINSALGARDQFNRDAPPNSQAIEVAASRVQDGNLAYAFNVFGRPQRAAVCDCERTTDPALPQTLYLMTDSNIVKKITGGRLKALLAEQDLAGKLKSKKISDEEIGEIIDELFLATLTRFPTDVEKQAAVGNVRANAGEAGLIDVAWALINTREFVLNH